MLSGNGDATSDVGSASPTINQDPLGLTGNILSGSPGKGRTDGKESCGVGTSFAANVTSALSTHPAKPALTGVTEIKLN
jgi:hypothetical protein